MKHQTHSAQARHHGTTAPNHTDEPVNHQPKYHTRATCYVLLATWASCHVLRATCYVLPATCDANTPSQVNIPDTCSVLRATLYCYTCYVQRATPIHRRWTSRIYHKPKYPTCYVPTHVPSSSAKYISPMTLAEVPSSEVGTGEIPLSRPALKPDIQDENHLPLEQVSILSAIRINKNSWRH